MLFRSQRIDRIGRGSFPGENAHAQDGNDEHNHKRQSISEQYNQSRKSQRHSDIIYNKRKRFISFQPDKFPDLKPHIF